MCEWLSSGEWCDVQLLCGGRAFKAHRAVLASVSSFLRRILISYPLEETPIFIVLPEFDLEAFSSVLHYIYNGEVIVQQQKIKMFLDIVKAMEIFVDHQYLQQLENSIEDFSLELCTHDQTHWTKYKNTFTLNNKSDGDQPFVTINKEGHIHDINLRYPQADFKFRDKQLRCKNWNEHQTCLGNVMSRSRQRSSFPRDVFSETYPPNGNSNGLTAGVQEISNEHYLGPTSVLLTNANGIHPRTADFLGEISTTTMDSAYDTYKNNGSPEYRSDICSKLLFYSDYFKQISQNGTHRCINMKSWAKLQIKHKTQPQMLVTEDMRPKTFTNRETSSVDKACDYISNKTHLKEKKQKQYPQLEAVGNIPRTSILNQVLENPWRPRVPRTFKPYNKDINDKKEILTSINDNNNNIQQSLTISTEETKEGDNINSSEEFKCVICSVVFSSNEELTEHARHHTVAGRYSCGECGKTFSQLRNFKYHMSVHRGTREFAATCTVCGKYFNDRGYLSSHMKIHRNRKEYKCSVCPKSFNQRVAYNMHVRIHTGVKPHVCEQCGKAFSRKMLLKQHQRTHSGERPYACPHCDKRFADRSNMTLHLRLHTGVKPFSCSLCPKSFTKKHHLKSHLNFHTGAKPYSCPRCKLAFTQSSNMRTHYKKCNAPETLTDK